MSYSKNTTFNNCTYYKYILNLHILQTQKLVFLLEAQLTQTSFYPSWYSMNNKDKMIFVSFYLCVSNVSNVISKRKIAKV